MNATETSDEEWRDLVDRAAAHDIRYLMGGSAWEGLESPYTGPDDVPLAPLLLDLVRAPEARLQSALIALLLRHPEDTWAAEAIARDLQANDPSRKLLLISIVVASALQHEWGFSLGLYLPNQSPIGAEHLAAELNLPSPAEDFGRPCLTAAARLLRQGKPFPFNYQADWENAVHRLLAQLSREADPRGA